jgi:hypothetical protein
LTKLAHLFAILLELHCVAGYRDHDFASVGRAPIKVRIDTIDEDFQTGRAVVMGTHQERGKDRSQWYILSDEDSARVKEGKTYSLVRSRSIRSADPFVLTCQQVRTD